MSTVSNYVCSLYIAFSQTVYNLYPDSVAAVNQTFADKMAQLFLEPVSFGSVSL